MPIAWKVDEPCPKCGDDNDVWRFDKDEGSVVKACYSCKRCGLEWSEIARVKD